MIAANCDPGVLLGPCHTNNGLDLLFVAGIVFAFIIGAIIGYLIGRG